MTAIHAMSPSPNSASPASVLVVDDEEVMRDVLHSLLSEAGHRVTLAHDGVEGLALAKKQSFDAAIVDVMLPGLDGIALVEALRGRGVRTPVLFLSARRSVDDRVRGLQAGGDDYLVKPFAFAELLARVQALVRRASGVPEATRLAVGDLELDLLTREVRRGGQRLELRPRELALLEHLMRNAGRVVSKAMILSHVYDYAFDPGTNVVDVLVHRLRDKIDKGFEPKLLHTARGMGYVLRAP